MSSYQEQVEMLKRGMESPYALKITAYSNQVLNTEQIAIAACVCERIEAECDSIDMEVFTIQFTHKLVTAQRLMPTGSLRARQAFVLIAMTVLNELD